VYLDGGRFGDVRVMGDPVADVRCQRRKGGLDDGSRAWRPMIGSGVRTNVVTHRVVMTSPRS